MNGNRQIIPVEYFFNNDLKYLQRGISTITYTTPITKTKATQYDLPGIEDMVQNIWSPVKVTYDKHALWGISHWRDQRKTFYGYARGLESTHDVYSTKHILAVTRVEEGNFPRLRINDIEDMLILIVQNKLTNLSGDDVSDFDITLRMFTRSMVIQNRVEDFQLGVKSYQKKINVEALIPPQREIGFIGKEKSLISGKNQVFTSRAEVKKDDEEALKKFVVGDTTERTSATSTNNRLRHICFHAS
ncbi:hypothetical protein Tco_1069442 [Tanacetum coccineum]|uniref:Uncharacterized protein n=1 Tax=Tanacetum coccineum TaxID=301880 RepID=A0ABQ5HIH1_9ASTR